MNLSTVCALGNKLSSGMDRKAAFKEAWRITRAGKIELKVAGVSFENRQLALEKLRDYQPENIHTVLVPEENTFDKNAISVMVMVNGAKGIYKIGYVSRPEIPLAKAFLGKTPQMRIIGGDIYGCRLQLTV